MDSLFKQMLLEYEINNSRDRENAIKQIIQEFVLCGLSRSGFFEHAAFCGGTALRIFYKLDRFSEDLDFSLTSVDKNFKLEKYFPMLIRELNSLGVKMEVQEKIKTGDSHVQSAFVKGNTRQLYLLFYTDPNIINSLHRDSLIRVKFEIDICPPPYANYEYKTRQYPYLYQVRIHDLPSLFAGKLNALIARKWRNRIKGRDFYDFIF
ncbi:MAG: nucleotidyl transferase AbiEii/AbiGii toxin family protein [Malacoplasma sp.]|nr:nucleotidyl transferase AbiEii/AbiGii toxin family protein [Malacoplasma sp.]